MANEKRLIDANLLIGTCEEIAKHEWNKRVSPVSWADAYEGFIDTIEEMPTVEAVEVVHGRWVEVDDGVLIGKGTHFECSECGKWENWGRLSNYCSNCGALMR